MSNTDIGAVDEGVVRLKPARLLVYIAAAAMAIQAVHLVEHLGQLGYWFIHPSEAPWLTPWAAAGRDGLAVGGNIPVGNELLHLIGNGLFLGGLVAMVALSSSIGLKASRVRWLVAAVVVQGIHVMEHVALTVSTVTVGKAIGLSTLFGFASGPFGSTYRVWFHFAINAAATVLAFVALKELLGRWLGSSGTDRRSTTTVSAPAAGTLDA